MTNDRFLCISRRVVARGPGLFTRPEESMYRVSLSVVITALIASGINLPISAANAANPAGQKTAPKRFEDYMQVGNADLQTNKPLLAIPLFTEAIKLRPNDAFARKCLAYALVSAGYAAQGAQQMVVANKLAVPSVEDLLFTGIAFAQANNYPQAIYSLQLALAADNRNPKILVTLAETQRKAGNVKEARNSAAKAIPLITDAELRKRAMDVLTNDKPAASPTPPSESTPLPEEQAPSDS